MESVTLTVQKRDKSIKPKVVRRSGMIPAEFYGHGIENESVQMEYQTFRKLFRIAGENTVIDLAVEGGGNHKVLVHRVDRHPVTDNFEYIEFINVRMDEKVTTNVAVNLEGQAPAVKEMAGVLVQHLHEIEITCLPGDLIHEVTLNVDSLVDFHTALHVSDIKVPSTVEILTPLDDTVAAVNAPREEEIEEAVEMDVSAVEVDGEAPAEGGEEGGDAGDKKEEAGE
jgi:large subunit ribosomal protein L25